MVAVDALVRMRYRPSGDVLVGQVELPGADLLMVDQATSTATAIEHRHDDRVEHVDADTTRTWRLITEGPERGRSMLMGFQVLGAATRLRTERAVLADVLPAPVARAASDMIVAAVAAADRLGADERARARAEAVVPVPLVELLEPPEPAAHASPSSSRSADLGSTRALAGALTHLADAIQAELVRLPVRSAAPADPGAVCIDALRSLASIISRHRQPAPGAAALATEAVRGGLPLSGSERALVRRALTDVDDIELWRESARSLERLAAALDDQRRLRHGRQQ